MFAATASLGAVWATCTPELGARSAVDRLGQLEPAVLITVSGYGFRDRVIDRRQEVAALREGLPTLRHVVEVDYGPERIPDALRWSDLVSEPGALLGHGGGRAEAGIERSDRRGLRVGVDDARDGVVVGLSRS